MRRNKAMTIGATDGDDTGGVINYDFRPTVISEKFQQPQIRFADKSMIERLVIKLQHQKQLQMMQAGSG